MSLDSETARDFDRPSEGYEYPSISSEQQPFFDESSFIEQDDADYRFRISSGPNAGSPFAVHAESRHEPVSHIQMAVGARPVSKSKLRSAEEARLPSPQMYQLAMNNSANCLKRGDVDSSVAWFVEAPAVPIAFASQYARTAGLVKDLRDQLMQERSDNIPLLCSFAISCASKGFPHFLYRLLPHIARFSAYERLNPFWNEFSQRARNTFKIYRPASSMPLLERTLIQLGNRIVRTLYLSEKYVDSLNFLKDLRSEERPLADPKDVAIEPDTYRIFLEELHRHQAHPSLIAQVESLYKADYVQSASADESTSSASSLHIPEVGSRNTVPDASHGISEEYATPSEGAADLLHPKAEENILAITPKAEFTRLCEMVQRGETIDRKTLTEFSRLCVERDVSYLFRTLARKMAVPTSERLQQQLFGQMARGHLPSVRVLSKFIDTCLQGRQPELAVQLGKWMQKQGMRYGSLWACARIHRLIKRGDRRSARDALQLYHDHFLLNGLPEPITRYLQKLDDSMEVQPSKFEHSLALPSESANASLAQIPSLEGEWRAASGKLRLPASSHSIVLAIQAWLTMFPTEASVTETYRSFLAVSYVDSEDARIPSQLMPDQVSFGPFLKYLSRKGKVAEAMRILNDMKERGVMPNAHNWDTVIGGFAKTGNYKMVGNIIQRMQHAQEILVHGQLSVDEERAFDQAGDSNSSLPQYVAVAGANGNPELGDMHRLLEGFEFQPPTIVTYTTTIRGFALAGKLERARYYMKKMFTARGPDGDLLYRFGRTPQAEKVLDILARMDRLAETGRRVSQRRVYAKLQ